MTGTSRFVCTDPDAGDFEFADVEGVLDALEAALIYPTTPLFDAVRQSWQVVGMHPEVRAAWEARLRFRPPTGDGLRLPELPSMTALARSLADGAGSEDERAEHERRREAFARVKAPAPGVARAQMPVEIGTHHTRETDEPRFAAMGLVWAALVLAVVGWALVTFAARLSEFAATAIDVSPRK
jgi:hypothetical protein